MGSSGLLDGIISFAQKNTVVAIVLALVLLFFMYRNPKMFFILLFLGLLVAGVLYMIMNMAGSGSEHKKKLIQEEQSNTNPSSPLGVAPLGFGVASMRLERRRLNTFPSARLPKRDMSDKPTIVSLT